MDGAARRIRREHNDDAWQAWHIEALARTKKLPKLATLLVSDGQKKRVLTGHELKAIAMQWKATISKGKPNG